MFIRIAKVYITTASIKQQETKIKRRKANMYNQTTTA